MKKLMKRFKNERGLTLVELLAVVVILAIIATIAFVLIGNVIDNSKKDAHIANAQQLIASAKLYEANGGTIDGTTGVSSSELKDADLLDKLIDPWVKTEYTTEATVTKDAYGKYYVTLTPNTVDNCSGITNKEEKDLLAKDARDTLCQ